MRKLLAAIFITALAVPAIAIAQHPKTVGLKGPGAAKAAAPAMNPIREYRPRPNPGVTSY